MPVLSISAVTPAADTLSVTAHGLSTGDGFLAVYSPDGGTLPAGLAAVTDYWAIVVDANTLKLASSSANALAGTAIDITTTGSGTLQLLSGLPYRRPRIMVPRSVDVAGAQVKSADLNGTFESLQALWAHLTGQAQSIFSGIKLAAGQHFTVSGAGGFKHGTRTLMIPASAFVADAKNTSLTQNGYQNFTSVAKAYAPIPLPAGKRITGITVYYDVQAAGAVTPALIRRNVAGAMARVSVWTGTADSTGATLESQTNAPNHVLLDTDWYEVEVTMSAAGNRLYGAQITYDEV